MKNARDWTGEIEEACLRPVIKSPKEAKGLVVDPANLKYRLFLPPVDPASADPKQDLADCFPLAYEYVKWGEEQRTPQGQRWSEVPSVQGRKAWWLIGHRNPADFLTMGFIDRRFFILENASKVFASDVMFEWTVNKSADGQMLIGLANSTLVYLWLEIIGRQNLGDGVLKVIGPELSSLYIPDPSIIPKKELLKKYKTLKQRPVKPIAQEVEQKDRQALDRAVLEALGLDPKDYLPHIYAGLVEMVEERLALPNLRQARKTREQRLSLEQVKEQIRREILPGGLKPITAFLPPGELAMEKVAVSGRPFSWCPFMNEFTLLDADGREVGMLCGNESQARYAVYAARAGEYLLKVPNDPILVGQTIHNYEGYLRQTARKLINRALQATRDHRQAERISREILESFGLPPMGVKVALG